MTRQYEKDVKFTDTWGGKVENELFTTFRGQDKLYTPGRIYPVIVVAGIFHKKRDYGYHRLIKLEFKRIMDVSPDEIIADIGRARAGSNPRKSFREIIYKFYGKKKWWDGEHTIIQKLYLEKIGGHGS
jgi:hypothetical protein